MPSNADIIKSIAEVSKEIGQDAPKTEGKNNAELADILSGLKAEKKKADDAKERAELEAKAEKDAAAAALLAKKDNEAKEPEAPKKPPFYVCEGKAVTTKRGIRADGAEITADDLAGGKEALDAFVKSGHVAKG